MTVRATTTWLRPCPGNGSRASQGLYRSGIREASAVVADFCEDPRSGQYGQAREASDDLGIRVREERLLGCYRELSDRDAGGVDLLNERHYLVAQGLFDLWQLAKVFRAGDLSKPLDLGFNATAWTLAAFE